MFSPNPFQDKIVLITGSGRGIGRALALNFAHLGADVVVNFFRNRRSAQATLDDILSLGRRSWLVKANIGEMDDLNRMFDFIRETIGGLDILVCNAASGYNRAVLEQKPKGWDWTMNINARSALFAAKLAAPLMEKRNGGSIVNITSPGANRVLPDYAVVGASKAAIEAITRYLAIEFSPLNIVVNAVSPGIVYTEALQHFDVIREDQALLKRALRNSPAGRLVTVEDIAYVVAFLCTPQASMIRGQVICVDGGYTLPIAGMLPERQPFD